MPSNVDVIRGAYEAFAKGDVAAVVGGMDEKIEWTEAAGFPLAGTYIGPDAVVESVFIPLGTDYDGFKLDTDTIIGQDDLVISVGTYSGTYKATGKSFRARFAHVWEIRDGKAVRFEQIVDSAKVQEALS